LRQRRLAGSPGVAAVRSVLAQRNMHAYLQVVPALSDVLMMMSSGGGTTPSQRVESR
jgi:hypothetical protein